MIIYSLDPGNMSGYCIIEVEWNTQNNLKEFLIRNVLDVGEFRYPDDILKHLSKARVADVIVIEDFIVRKNLIGDKIYAIRVIGAYESLFQKKVIFQQPSEKTRVPDSILKANGLWSNSPHKRDAFRHLLIYLYKNRGRQTIGQNRKRRLNASKL